MPPDPGRIVVSGLTKRFGGVHAVEDLSFTVESATLTGFLGPNGAGKTTTLRMLLGLVAADAGSATIGGRPYGAWPTPPSQVGAVLDSAGFHPRRTGREHLRIHCTVNGYPRGRADDVLAQVGLVPAGDRRVGGYSLGMRQRLALATALLGDPPVLVLDEPANGLDPEGISWLRRLLRSLVAEGRTVLVSSHVLSEVQQLVEQVVIVNRGRLVRQGSLDQLAATSRRAVAVRTPDVERLQELLTAGADRRRRVERSGPGELRIHDADPAEIGHLAFRQGIELQWLAAESSDLEEVFLQLTMTPHPEPTDAEASPR